jgi:hypothetical protein
MSRHLRLLGILWLVAGALNLAGAGFVWFAADVILPRIFVSGFPAFVPGLVKGVAFLILLKGAVSAAAGWGLLERESWARTVTLALAFLSLFNVPFGTALGIYSLWVLLPDQARDEYHRMACAA